VHGVAPNWVLVDTLQQDRRSLAATDLEIDQRVSRGRAPQDVEVARIELDGLGLPTAAIDDCWEDALTTQSADLLAEDLAGLGGHDRTGAHSSDL